MKKKMNFRRKIVTWLVVMAFLIGELASVKSISQAAAGIAGNGTQGIYIDINAAPYTTMAQVPVWGKYAYGVSGCAWFATSRAKQLTGKNITNIYAGPNWYNNMYKSFGFSRGRDIPTTQKALACYKGHISVVEKVVGNTVYISEGGNQSYGGNRYCCIRGVSKAYLTGANINGGFIGFVYLGISQGAGQGYNPQGCLDIVEGGTGTVRVRGWAFDRDNMGTGLDVHVYIGGPAGSGAEGHAIKANTYRPDVHNVYGCGSYHGFDATISTGVTGNKTVYVYAINIGGGSGNPEIGHKNAAIKAKQVPAITFTGQRANFIQSTNAELYVKINNPKRLRFSRVGCYLYNSSGKLVKSYSETCTLATSYVNYICNFKSDMKYTLSARTTYKYVLYAVVNGVTYKDGMRQFTTR